MRDYIQFESLPNEIFTEIFDYLSLDNLYQSFQGLNQRINSILQSLNNRVCRLWSTDKMNEIEMNNFFSTTIGLLAINDEYDINLNNYPKIHSLIYTYATEYQIQHLLQWKFSHENLKSLNVTSDDLSILIQYMFENSFPSLTQCILRNIDTISSPWKISPSINSINICNNENLIPLILKSCPNLKYLSISIFEYSNKSSSLSIYHSNLKYLSIEMNQPGWTIEMIEILFLSIQTPCLQSFRVISHQSSFKPFDFSQLIEIFNQHLSNLHRFQCDILVSKTTVEIMELKAIRDLHQILFNHLHVECHSNDILRIYTNN